jgi:hypothetical protein
MAGETPGDSRGGNMKAYRVCIIKCGNMAGATKCTRLEPSFKKNQQQRKRKWKGNNDNINKKFYKKGP